MTEPTPGTISDNGVLRRIYRICPNCGAGFWALTTSKKRKCRTCRTGRAND
jgi:ribosomal protein S27AE